MSWLATGISRKISVELGDFLLHVLLTGAKNRTCGPAGAGILSHQDPGLINTMVPMDWFVRQTTPVKWIGNSYQPDQ